ncbi:MAG: hypothetical protein KJN84_06970 [Bacteroidia bacterium]|nr:hypothetical protein [Bacteroidia bacterium]
MMITAKNKILAIVVLIPFFLLSCHNKTNKCNNIDQFLDFILKESKSENIFISSKPYNRLWNQIRNRDSDVCMISKLQSYLPNLLQSADYGFNENCLTKKMQLFDFDSNFLPPRVITKKASYILLSSIYSTENKHYIYYTEILSRSYSFTKFLVSENGNLKELKCDLLFEN